jgi:hypothetical protein
VRTRADPCELERERAGGGCRTDQHRQETYEEFKRLYHLSPDAEAVLEQLVEETDLFGDAPIAIDFDLMAEFLTKLTDEEFDELLYPFGK